MQVATNANNELIKVKRKYTLGEELINAISHGIGAGLGITALVLCIIMSAMHHNGIAVVASCIYGSSLIILYTISCLYQYIMRNAGLEEAEAEIKIIRRNINNLRYADDTILMAESHEDLDEEPLDEGEKK